MKMLWEIMFLLALEDKLKYVDLRFIFNSLSDISTGCLKYTFQAQYFQIELLIPYPSAFILLNGATIYFMV